jgi:hypothetical protein
MPDLIALSTRCAVEPDGEGGEAVSGEVGLELVLGAGDE